MDREQFEQIIKSDINIRRGYGIKRVITDCFVCACIGGLAAIDYSPIHSWLWWAISIPLIILYNILRAIEKPKV